MLTGGPYETGELRLECTELNTGTICADERQRCQLSATVKRQVHIRVGELRFPSPGEYRFALSFDGQKIAEQIVTVAEVP